MVSRPAGAQTAMGIGARGIADGYRRFNEAAQKMVDGDEIDPRDVVEAKLARHQVEASAKTVSVADKMLGTLIDELA